MHETVSIGSTKPSARHLTRWARLTHVLRKAGRYARREGTGALLYAGYAYARSKMRRSGATFAFRGATYRYVFHERNSTWDNERAVELAIVQQIVREHAGKRILEIGNVLHQYGPIDHDVVDKYEQGAGVLNVDVIDFQPDHGYDLIVSISTLEHVGWDEAGRDPGKTLRAVEHLTRLLNPGGMLVVTFPIGYNLYLDALLRDESLRFDEQAYLWRVSPENHWEEATWAQVRGAHYDLPYPKANALVVGINRAPADV